MKENTDLQVLFRQREVQGKLQSLSSGELCTKMSCYDAIFHAKKY